MERDIINDNWDISSGLSKGKKTIEKAKIV